MNILAIGGGGIGRPGKPPYQIKKFDEEIIKMTKKNNPKLLFIPFSQHNLSDAQIYFDVLSKNFNDLECSCDVLFESDLKNQHIIESKINNADIIYVAGGDTLRLMKKLRKYQIDKLLKNAGDRGVVLCGVSAGGICWHKYGNSDTRRYTSDPLKIIKVTGLGFINALFCPHYDAETHRHNPLQHMLKKSKYVGIALDNCVAIQIIDNNYKILKIIGTEKARKMYWQKDNYIIKEIPTEGKVSDLISKN